ncbi:MAG: META domain-containing protein [Clostridium sp.]|nr:META domain-containing protein [Clostridium sp.]
MRHISSFLVATLLIVIAGAGCKTIKKTVATQPAETPVERNIADNIAEVNKILHGRWTVLSVNGQNVTGEDRPYVEFDSVASNPFLSKFYAFNGCNVVNGQVSVTPKGSMMKASDYLSTLKYCPEAEYEIGVSMVLETLKSYRIEKIGNEYLLYMNSSDKNQSMVLRRDDSSFFNGAWAVTRVGDVVYDKDAGMELVIDIPEMKIHGNTGCNILNGKIEIDPDQQHSLRFADIITTRMACDNPAREQAFLDALNQTVTAERDGDNGAILRDSSGSLVIEMKRLKLEHNVGNGVE